MKAIIIAIIIAILIYICIFVFDSNKKINKLVIEPKKQLNNFFYEVDDVNKDLMLADYCKHKMLKDAINVYNDKWKDWPEKNLYESNGTWKIFPFYAFGVWANENCKKCPEIHKFIKNIRGLKLATLSKLSPGMKLVPHEGWGFHSNHVIRCHYGLIVPENCYISVSDGNHEEIKYHKNFEWLIFDDSKTHYAENKSEFDRIVLIIDVERPSWIKTGVSKVGDSKELLEIVDYFKKKNISI
jgi:hypothetical protein